MAIQNTRLVELARSVMNEDVSSPYERALAATALGRELRAVRLKSHNYVMPKSESVQDALLDLIGYACRQQKVWQVWAQSLPRNQKRCGILQLPPGADISIEDAKKMRENCAAVLAMLVAQHRNEALPSLRELSKTPESVHKTARLIRFAIEKRQSKKSPTSPNNDDDNNENDNDHDESDGDLIKDTEDPLKLVRSVTSIDAYVEQRVNAALAASEIKDGPIHEPTAVLSAYLKQLESNTQERNQKNESSHGYLRTASGGYRQPRESLSSRHRPAVLYLNDTEPPTEIAGLGDINDADRRLGYHTSRVIVANTRPVKARGTAFAFLSPRAGGDPKLRAMRPVNTEAILREHTSINALATYASTVVRDPSHPRSSRFRNAFAASTNRFDNSGKKLLPILHPQCQPIEDDDSQQVNESILDKPHPIIPVSPKDVRRLIAWTPGSGVAAEKDTAAETQSTSLSPISPKVMPPAHDAKFAWRDLQKEKANLSVTAQIENAHTNDTLATSLQIVQDDKEELPLTILARYGSSSCDPDQRLRSAINVRGRLQNIFARWIQEFEKAQLTAALALWRIAKLEAVREENRIEYRQKAAVSKLQTFFSHRRRVRIARAFAKLISRTAWLIFYERDVATLKIQTVYRRAQAQKFFVACHDAMPIGGEYLADIYLVPERRSRKVKFKINARVRVERRKAWKAATLVQSRYRRRIIRRHYIHVRRTATKFEATLRMWPVRALYVIKRRRAIVIATAIRMFLVRQPYLRLCAAARIAQRVLRGHAGRCIAYTKLNRKRYEIELRVTAPRSIQNIWRGYKARKLVAGIRADNRALNWAGLKLQCTWYKNRGAFPTFLLLSCLRVSDIEDREFARKVRLNARNLAQRRLTARFRGHRIARHQDAAQTIAAYWRRFVSFKLVLGLRQSKWARRKMQSFVRTHMKRRHAASRRIQFLWFRARSGRFLRHLEVAIAREERALDQIRRREYDLAAANIQAIIHGQFTRNELRRNAASLIIQRQARVKLAYLAVQRRYAQLRSLFSVRVVHRFIRTSLFTMLNDYRQNLRISAISIQAVVRSRLLRSAVARAWHRARRLTWAAMLLQKAIRRRAAYLTAMAKIGLSHRAKTSAFGTCETFNDVLQVLGKYAEIPQSIQEPWLWFDSNDFWAGVGPHAVCRRSGCIASSLSRKVKSIRALAQQQLSTSNTSDNNEENNSLDNAILLARALATTKIDRIIDDSIPLVNPKIRYTASVFVCAQQFAEISKRKIEALASRDEIFSIIKFDKLPFPCRKLITALSEESLLTSGSVPRDLSLRLLKSMCERYADADRVLRALRNRELGNPPWLPSVLEIQHNKARIQRAYERRRDALEQLQQLLMFRETNHDPCSLLGSLIGNALTDGKAAIGLAELRTKRTAKKLRKKVRGDQKSIGAQEEYSASRSTIKPKSKNSQKSSIPKPDIPQYLRKLELDRPGILEGVDFEHIFTMVPGVEDCERTISFIIANEIYTKALQILHVYVQAANRVSAAMKMRLSRRMMSAVRHARAVGRVKSAYMLERSGQAVKSVWEADMKKYAEEKAIQEQDSLAAKKRQDTQNRLWYILRHGWRQMQIRLGQLEKSLRDDHVEDMELSTMCTVYERLRPPKPRPIHRFGQKIDPKFRDDDSARDTNSLRIVVPAQKGANVWESRERERQRVRPLYDIEDDAAGLVIQTSIRRRLANKIVSKRRKDKVKFAREVREYELWKSRHAERLRHVTVRMTVEDIVPIINEIQDDTVLEDSMDPRATSPFEPTTTFSAFVRGLHVLARFNGIGHWYAGTIFDAERNDVFGVMFDDGNVDANVNRIDIRVPKIQIGLRVEALYKDKNELYEATVVEVFPNGTCTVRYDDGEIEEQIDRTRLRILNADKLLQAETKHLHFLRTQRATRLREAVRLRRKNQIARRFQQTADLIRSQFATARSIFVPDKVCQEHQEREENERNADPHALALAEMAICLKKLQNHSKPQWAVKLRIDYTRVALRFGWREVTDDNGNTYFAHISGQTSWDFPSYDFEEEVAARYFQRCFRNVMHRREMDLTLGSAYLPKLIKDTREAAIRLAWTPSSKQGDVLDDQVPLELWMARRGFGQAAILSVMKIVTKQASKTLAITSQSTKLKQETKNSLHRAKVRMLQRLRVLSGAGITASKDLAVLKKASTSATTALPTKRTLGEHIRQQQLKEEEQLESLGLIDLADRQWLRTTTEDMGRFVAYWDSCLDDRDMLQILKNAKEAYVNELEKLFKNQHSRCEHMAESLMESRFPISIGQIHRLGFDFAGKPAAAQEAVHARIVNLPTTSSQGNELKALGLFVAGAKRVQQLCERMKLQTLAQITEETIDKSREICTPPSQTNFDNSSLVGTLQHAVHELKEPGTNESTGAAARACWILNDTIFNKILTVWHGTVQIQKHSRRRATERKYILFLARRIEAAIQCQSAWRKGLARRIAALLRSQQSASIHMLWDESVEAFYFLDTTTSVVSWDEPIGGKWSYRPQVQDRFTRRFVLAWPQLDRPKPLYAQQPQQGKCMVCKIEEATRACLKCALPKFDGQPPNWGDGYYHFCFSCFISYHDPSPILRDHDFAVTKEITAPSLACCVCAAPATRKCRGLVLQARGREMLHQFFLKQIEHTVDTDRSVWKFITPSTLRNVFRQAGMPLSLERVEDMHTSCKDVVDVNDEVSRQVASYHAVLLKKIEEIGIECSDFYCVTCWSTMHAKGARARHCWSGFAAGAPACALCENAIASFKCEKCGDFLCGDCSKAAHAKGKNREHEQIILRENLDDETATYCRECDVRRGTEKCRLCSAQLCDSCYLFKHTETCDKRNGAKAIAFGVDIDYPTKCAICGRKPDSRCEECDEVYCTWMGKPRCFAKHHAKGNRRTHRLVPYNAMADMERRRREEEETGRKEAEAFEAERARTAAAFERACEEARRAKEEQDELIDAKAEELLAQHILNERAARRLQRFSPQDWLYSIMRKTWRFAEEQQPKKMTVFSSSSSG